MTATHYMETGGEQDMAIAIGYFNKNTFTVISYVPATALQIFSHLKKYSPKEETEGFKYRDFDGEAALIE